MGKVTISAELGINHNGDPEIAERMIDAAAECGADAVKVQSFRCKDFLPEGHPDWGLFEQCEIWPYLERLTNYAHSKGLLFGVTASATYGVMEAVECGADFLKNASDAILRHDLIEAMLATGLPTWVSTGMASVDEIDATQDIPHTHGQLKWMLCTSMYPCPWDQVNLNRLGWGLKGFSDHTRGFDAAFLACSYPIEMIEKHFTLDNEMDGPDHWFSANPFSLKLLVKYVRLAETIMGDGELGFMPGEVEGREKWRLGPNGELRSG